MATQGKAYCSMEAKVEDREFEKVGPDGNGWVLLNGAAEVKAFCDVNMKLFHQRLAVHHGKHVCAYFGGWGFTADGVTTSVVFLRYEFKGKLSSAAPTEAFKADIMDTTVGIFGHDLYKYYKKALNKQPPPHVWKRDAHGEIAINFCVG
jgi:hypothetical protein